MNDFADPPDYDECAICCSFCGQAPTRIQECNVIDCDDGWIWPYEEEDLTNNDANDGEFCENCQGSGYLHWCPACGADLNPPLRKKASWR